MNPVRATVVLLFACAGCAHLPEGTVGYYLPRTTIGFKVVRTMACDADGEIIIANAVTPVVVHSADRSKLVRVSFSPLRSVFADSDLKFDFYDDGRLKNVNATLTGHGEEILKTVISIAASSATMTSMLRLVPTDECAFIKRVGGDKPITLTYEGDVDLARETSGAQDVLPDAASRTYADKLRKAIGTVCAFVVATERPSPPFVENEHEGALLTARQPGLVQISVRAGPGSGCTSEIWRGKLPVAQKGTDYDVPIPKAPVFGKQVFAISFAESGAVTSLQYATTIGTGQALNVVDSALATAQGLAAKKTAAINAEADLIVAQQRLVQCQADPKSCK